MFQDTLWGRIRIANVALKQLHFHHIYLWVYSLVLICHFLTLEGSANFLVQKQNQKKKEWGLYLP